MIAVVIPTCNHQYVPPDYGSISVIVVYDDPSNPRGFASSCNIGISKAHADNFSWVLICNDDADISLNDLHTLMAKIDEDTGVIAPVIVDDHGHEEAGIKVSGWGRVRMMKTTENREPDAVSGACMLIPSWARFDSGFLHGFEDVALCLLLKKRGKKITIHRDARCIHLGGGTLTHHTRAWFARSIYGQLRLFSSPILSIGIVSLGCLQARNSLSNVKGVWDGYRLWKDQRSSKET